MQRSSGILANINRNSQQFENRFNDFNIIKKDLIIFNNAKECKIEEWKITHRLELYNLQAVPFIMSKSECKQEFFKLLSEKKDPTLVHLNLKGGHPL